MRFLQRREALSNSIKSAKCGKDYVYYLRLVQNNNLVCTIYQKKAKTWLVRPIISGKQQIPKPINVNRIIGIDEVNI